MAGIPVLLNPEVGGTVLSLPFFELYSYSTDPNLNIQFRIKIVKVEDSSEIVIGPTDAGWSKVNYVSNEIAVYQLSGDDELEEDKEYKWQAQSYDGVVWSNWSDLISFFVLKYRGDSDLGIFTVSEDALENISPQLISVESPLQGDEGTITSRIPTFTWDIPYGLGEGIHFRFLMDVIINLSSRNRVVFESKFDSRYFQMYDGIQWVDFPETGTVFGATRTRITLPDTFFNDKYFWNIVPAI